VDLPSDVAVYISGTDLPSLQSQAGFKLIKQNTVEIGGATYHHLVYHILSPADPVTGKQVPSTVDRYYVPGPAHLAIVSLSTPDGVDNVDAFPHDDRELRVVIDLGFAILIAVAGATLFLLAGLAERRWELATLIAIGAEPGQVRRSLAGETVVIGLAGIASGLVTGGLIALALLQILAGVFDPPADLPAVPVVAIIAAVGCVAGALGIALGIADRGIARLGVVSALRER
jgi:hypothetical protein